MSLINKMIMHHHNQQQQQHHQQQAQFLSTNLCSNNSRPHSDDSTPHTDDSSGSSPNSMSTTTPPHSDQICMRVSPASTTLMASSNNINNIQPSSWQLSPTNGVSSSSNNGGTGSSSGATNGQQQQHHHHRNHNHHNDGAAPVNHGHVARQFACHAKSMSAGVVVSVPGISSNLASATGMNQNNVINNHIATSNTKQHHQQVATGATNLPPSNHHQPNTHNGPLLFHQNTHSGTHYPSHRLHHHQAPTGQQPTVFSRTAHRERNHQRQQQSYLHHQQAATMMHPHQHNNHQNGASHHSISQNEGSASNFLNIVDHPQASRRTSIIPAHHHNGSNLMPPNHHNRSSSAQLAGVPMVGNSIHHTQSNNLMNSTSTTAVASVRHGSGLHPNTTNSIWSIDEHMSKSQSKLASSTYLAQHPYLFNPSITDMSCDNVSQSSRLPDAASGPGYYKPSATGATGPNAGGNGPGTGTNLLTSNGLSVSGSLKGPEFLPICDLLFNLISMIVYFCESTFGIIALIALYYHSSNQHLAIMGALFVICSNIVSQYLSFKWLFKAKLDDCKRKREAQEELETEGDCERRYFNRMATNMNDYPCGSCAWMPDSATEIQLKFLISITIDVILHLFCLGFLVRYIKLVIPIKDMACVRREARDLCMLRMVHGFIQSAPLLLLQVYVICMSTNQASSASTPLISLSITSATLSLINVCWALASFTKYARKKYLQRFILTTSCKRSLSFL